MGFVGDEDQVRGGDHLYSGGTCWYSCSVGLMHTFFFWAASGPKKVLLRENRKLPHLLWYVIGPPLYFRGAPNARVGELRGWLPEVPSGVCGPSLVKNLPANTIPAHLRPPRGRFNACVGLAVQKTGGTPFLGCF